MQSSIRDYVSEGTTVSYSQLRERFGEPKLVAADYISEMEMEELFKQLQIRRKTVKIIAATMTVMVLLWVGCVTFAFLDHRENSSGHIFVEIIEVERRTIDEGD